MMKMRLSKVGDSSGLRRLLGLIIAIMLLPGLFPMQVRAANSGAAEAWMWPLGSSAGLRKFTSHLGRRDVQGGSLDHQGIDINCKTGTPVYASKSGVVCNIGDETTAGSRGTFVRINHRDGTYSQYQHLKFRSYTVKVNQEVRQGDLIGYSGKTGGIDRELIPCMLSAGQTQQKIALPDAWGECEMKAYALDSSNDSPLTASFVIHADTSNGSGLS